MDRPRGDRVAGARLASPRRAPEVVLRKKEARVDQEHRFDQASRAAVAILDRHAQRIDPHNCTAPHELYSALLQAGVRRADIASTR